MCIKKRNRKKRWSLVRILASCIPNFLWKYLLPVSPRMVIGINVIERVSSPKQSNNKLDDSNSSFCSFKTNFHNMKKHELLNSTPKREDVVDNVKIRALEQELNEIKKQVAKLLEHHTEQIQYSDYGTLTNSVQLQKSYIPPPPPLPPPPLPNPPFKPSETPYKADVKLPNVVPQNGFPFGKNLLKDLKKVQLRKVEKSPGGGPLKKSTKVVNDLGDFLEEVLKKRFKLVQNSPDSSVESASIDTNNSYSSVTQNNSVEFQKHLKAK